MSFEPVSINKKNLNLRVWAIGIGFVVVLLATLGYWLYAYRFAGVSARWEHYQALYTNPHSLVNETLLPGHRCAGSPLAFPLNSVIFGYWGQASPCGNAVSGVIHRPETHFVVSLAARPTWGRLAICLTRQGCHLRFKGAIISRQQCPSRLGYFSGFRSGCYPGLRRLPWLFNPFVRLALGCHHPHPRRPAPAQPSDMELLRPHG